MTTNNPGWVGADSTSPIASSSNLADGSAPRYTATVGSGGGECMPGRGFTPNFSGEHRWEPEPDPISGLTFQSKTGGPVPAGGPRPTDLVTISGMQMEVRTAIQIGEMPDIYRPGYTPQGGLQRPFGEPEGFTQSSPEGQASDASSASDGASTAAADDFLAFSVPAISPMAIDSIMQSVAENSFDDLTLAYLQLEGKVSLSEFDGLRDSFAAKISEATGWPEADLEDLYYADRDGFSRAVKTMLKDGTADSFRELADRADAASYVPLPASEAVEVWRSNRADFVDAIIKAGIKVSLTEGNEVAIDVPGKGTVLWADAVRQGLVKVSRAA